MIVVTITIEEEAKNMVSQGLVTGIDQTKKEERMVRDLMKAIERYCTSRMVEGARFVRRDLPANGESLQSD